MIEKGYASSQEHWKIYNDYVGRFASTSPVSEEFYSSGVAVFDLAANIIDPLTALLPDLSQYEPNEHRIPNQQFLTMWDDEDISPHFKNGVYLRLTQEFIWKMTDLYEHIAEDIETLLGTSFRLVASSAWYISSDCEDVGPSAEHTDGLPESFYKIMIYPSPLNEEDGTIMLRNADGHAEYVETDGPVWMLFDSNRVSHQGIKPKRPDIRRYLLQGIISRSVVRDMWSVTQQINSRQPAFPWYRGYKDGH